MSGETSKALVERPQGGAVASVSGPPVRKRPAKTVLEEEEFTEALTTIIRRDFFPDVPKLEAQLEFIEASESNDYERLRAISERFATTQRTPQPAAATPATFETPLPGTTPRGAPASGHTLPSRAGASEASAAPPDAKKLKPEEFHGLDHFLSKHESEDDAAFAEIMEKTKEQHRAKHAWLYEKEREYTQSLCAPEERLAITDGSEGRQKEKEEERSGVKSWAYTAKNSLMYFPEGVERSAVEKISEPEKEKKVVHSNTRLSSDFVRKMHSSLKAAGGEEGGTDGKASRDKVGVDGRVLDPSSSPQVKGYGFVATPQIQPGVDASPLMTWGSIEGTPLRLETDITPGHGPTFKMPKIPKREVIAHRLADKVTKSTRERKKAAAQAASPALLRQRLGTPATPSERLQLLSPAARKLASRTATPSGGLHGVDKALRQSYTPTHTPLSTPQHKGSHSGTTPRLRTPEGNSTPSLTDNLLNLKDR